MNLGAVAADTALLPLATTQGEQVRRSGDGDGRWWLSVGLFGARPRVSEKARNDSGARQVAKAGLMAVLVVGSLACGGDAGGQGPASAESSTSTAATTEPGQATVSAPPGTTTPPSSTSGPDDGSTGGGSPSGSSGTTSGSTTGGSESGDETAGPVDSGPAGPGWEPCVGVEGEPCTLGGACLVNTYDTAGVCSVPCVTPEDCPEVGGGNAEPLCAEIGTGQCTLSCAEGRTCPDDMVCIIGDVCAYYAPLPQDGKCPNESHVGAPQSISGTLDGMGDDLAPLCWYNYEDIAVEFTAQESGWYYFDAEHPSAQVQSMSIVEDCGGSPLACRSGFAQFIAEVWLELEADQTVVVSLDGAGDYQLDIEFIGEAEDGHCCFGSFEGCGNEVVTECVCAASPDCCNGAWGAQCATLARDSCDASCPVG
ncbi:MAG: hypothetical protein KUG77_19720 [Nannocystaceae bacterium]|nr:hypothetical protein [Nannocystaceae bacterium]